MVRISHRLSRFRSRKCNTIFLAFSWIVGLYCGIELSCFAGNSFFSLMRGASSSSVSIVNLLLITLLPFLISGLIMYIRSTILMHLLCYIKGLTFGFVSAGFFSAWGSAGWLIRYFLMFSDFLSLVPLWWSWITAQIHSKTSFRPVLIGTLIAGCIVCLDFFCISPIAARLFEY